MKESKIPKFRRCVLQNFPFIEQDFDALTDYELLCKVVQYLNLVIDSQNGVVDDIDTLNTEFEELKNYVTNYFKNLDVQEEINNKLEDMAESGELETIIAQFLAVAPVFGYDTIADMESATNLINGSIARVLGNTDLTDGDGAFYKIRTKTESDVVDGVQIVAIGDDLVAIRIVDAGLINAENKIEDLDNAQFNQVRLYQNFIYNAWTPESFQGSCVDENNILYQYASKEYETPASEYGTLYKFNITTHSYIGKLENAPLYHGNSLAYDNGYIWAAATLHDGNPSNKIVKYNVSDGTSEEFTPFADSFIVRVNLLCLYENDIFACGSLSGNALGNMKFARLNKSTMEYEEYSLVNNKHFNIANNILSGMAVSDGKIYILTDGDDLLFELIVDNDNKTLTINKVYEMPDQNDTFLEIGEYQGLTALPVDYYGKKSFIVTSFMSSGAAGANRSTAIYVHNMNLESDMCPIAQPLDNQYYPYKLTYIHVAKNGGTNLVEDGTSDHPFKTVQRAIEFANSVKAHGRTVAEIYIDDSESYDIGNVSNLDFVINSNDYSPSLYVGNVSNCNITIKANTNIKLYKIPNTSNIYLNYQSKMYLDNVTVYDNIYAVRNSGIFSNNLTVAYSGQDWFTQSAACESRINVVSATNVTRYVVSNRNTSLLLINSEMTSKVYTDNNAYTLFGA